MAEDEKPQRWLVTPGEVITEERLRLGPGVYVQDGKIVAKVLGLAEIKNGMARVVPLEGNYVPKQGDTVVGIVVDVKIPGYDVDINSPYKAFLPRDQIRDALEYGDVVVATVRFVDEVKNSVLENARKLEGGQLIYIASPRVPRVIGKNASMITNIKNLTGSKVIVGANGRIWIKGGHSDIARDAIYKIEREAHTHGLTDRIAEFIRDRVAEEEGNSESDSHGEESKEE
ncbi:MAG: RNA-binding protein [Candidatus Diapherotrites archaeon]|nr:RNA-binding protein [Candidatus Diapherotrites archaeon]